MTSLHITGGTILRDGRMEAADLGISNGRITNTADGRRINAGGLLVLPGIVDIHGDAFERQIQPRPGVNFPMLPALIDTERQLLANGITTAFHGITLSWEPGLRGIETWRALLAGLAARAWTCDMRVHLRFESYNFTALDEAIADIEAGRVHLLAFNDHTPSILKRLDDDAKASKYSDRAGIDLPAFRARATKVGARGAEVPAALARIAAAARAAGIAMASHDDDTVATRDSFRDMGARICEFPMEEAVGRAARAAGDAVVMGAPNVLRGGSHLGWASAAVLAEAGICSVLSSDYYYPAMLRAAFILVARGKLDLPAAWALISENPARAGNLTDRGTFAAGQRGDAVLVEDRAGGPDLIATIIGGEVAWLSAEGARRLC